MINYIISENFVPVYIRVLYVVNNYNKHEEAKAIVEINCKMINEEIYG